MPRARAEAGPAAYEDVIPILDTALLRGGAKFLAPTERQAIAAMHRMNRWRRYDRERNGNSRYDAFVIRRDGTTVIIERRPALADILQAFDLSGQPIPIERPLPGLSEIETAVATAEGTGHTATKEFIEWQRGLLNDIAEEEEEPNG